MTTQYRIEVRAQEPLDAPDAAVVCADAARMIAERLFSHGTETYTVELVEVMTPRTNRVLDSYARAAGGELATPMMEAS